MCRTLTRDDFCFFTSPRRALRAASQSNTEWMDRALNGEPMSLELKGESRLEMAGLGGTFKLGKQFAPVGGADMGSGAVNGVGGTAVADAGDEGLLLAALEAGDGRPSVEHVSDLSLAADVGAESGEISPGARAGELSDRAFERKSVYANGGLMGVLM